MTGGAWLFECDAGHDDRREYHVPLRGNVFIGDLDVPLLAGKKRRGRWKKQALLVAQDHLIEGVVKFKRDFNLVDLAVAAVFHRAKHVGDFLVQEMNREVNTIGSKANDSLISREIVTLKAELERFREQVQNVE